MITYGLGETRTPEQHPYLSFVEVLTVDGIWKTSILMFLTLSEITCAQEVGSSSGNEVVHMESLFE